MSVNESWLVSCKPLVTPYKLAMIQYRLLISRKSYQDIFILSKKIKVQILFKQSERGKHLIYIYISSVCDSGMRDKFIESAEIPSLILQICNKNKVVNGTSMKLTQKYVKPSIR